MSVTQMTTENLPVPEDAPANGVVDSHDSAQPRSTTEPEVHGEMDRQAQIRQLAYAAYQRRGSVSGSEVDDWLQAERLADGGGPLPSLEKRSNAASSEMEGDHDANPKITGSP